jgi:hypothetical protein
MKINLTATWAATDMTVDVTGCFHQPAPATQRRRDRKTRTTTGGAATESTGRITEAAAASLKPSSGPLNDHGPGCW